ncbi:hypothetical protein [Lederbergia lenta]|uniref:Flagellar protein FliT n=1 Tax=Lederbergia lenta TaxID=1467 RepID=A0A2X4WQH1_LEDLE|nr:hypothetical protein [Lederbergia lenta]MCM3113111.1 flagellar protein FliT [Lederbergia lenta]MEC2322839.1 flagellar protein FliT [Lederbergia lenta]SQI61908.1 flagellar protein [Lederbergia lenta]
MKKQLETCVLISEQLLEQAKTVNDQERDEQIKRIEELLQQREEVLPHIHGPFTPEEMTIGKHLLQINIELDALLTNIQMTIQKDMNQLEKKKTSATRYANPYASMQELDGAFYDKRK